MTSIYRRKVEGYWRTSISIRWTWRPAHNNIVSIPPRQKSTRMRISFAVAAALAGLARLSDQQVSAIPVHQAGGSDGYVSMSIRDDVYDPDESRPTQYYMPTHPLHHDPSDFAHLKPQTSGQLYYTKDGSSGEPESGMMSWVSSSVIFPSQKLKSIPTHRRPRHRPCRPSPGTRICAPRQLVSTPHCRPGALPLC